MKLKVMTINWRNIYDCLMAIESATVTKFMLVVWIPLWIVLFGGIMLIIVKSSPAIELLLVSIWIMVGYAPLLFDMVKEEFHR